MNLLRWILQPAAKALAGLLILTVRLYQVTLGLFLGGQCKFVPSCSHYFVEAVRTRGPIVGTAMGLWRVLRCNPFSKGGYDPVKSSREFRELREKDDNRGS